jgi:hypothetical protein
LSALKQVLIFAEQSSFHTGDNAKWRTLWVMRLFGEDQPDSNGSLGRHAVKAVFDDMGAFRVDTRDSLDPGCDSFELVKGGDLRLLQGPPHAHGQAKAAKRIIGRLVATRTHCATKSSEGAADLLTILAAAAENSPTDGSEISDMTERYQYLGQDS